MATRSKKDVRDCAVYAEGWTKGPSLFLQGVFTKDEAHRRGVDLVGRGLEVVLWEGVRDEDKLERTMPANGQPGVRTIT